jgi:hypothetical protein
MQNNVWKKELAVIVIGLFIAMSFNLSTSGNKFIDNHSPYIPHFPTARRDGYIEETYTFQFTTIDPDGDDVYYFIDWDDGSNSGWLGPYKSGETGEENHAWEDAGIYYYRIKAKDSNGAESNWSSQSSSSITITPHIEMRIHRGFHVGVTVTVKNLGVKDFENIFWYFSFYKSPPVFARIVPDKPGTLKSLKAGEIRTIRSGFIFGFSLKAIIGFTLGESYNMKTVSCSDCKMLGPFVYIPFIPRNP